MPRIKLTAAAVERLKPPLSGQVDYFDKAYPGLALRVSASGVRSWVYFGRVHGRLKRVTMGRHPGLSLTAARRKAAETVEAMAQGINPTVAKRKTVRGDRDTFEAVVAEWLKRDQGHNRSVAEVRRIIERDVLPDWSGRRITKISRRDVLEVIDSVADRGAVIMARRLHAHLHRLFRWCVGRGILETNPATDLPKPGAPVRRDRVLSDHELATVWQAADRLGLPFGTIFRLLILTAARRDEIGSLRWSEFRGDRIELAGSRTKNAEPRVIPLVPTAAEMIAAVPRLAGSEFVFTTTGRTAVSGWSRAKTLLDKSISASGGDPLPDWRIHDIRRSAATGLQRLRVNLQTIETVLGHVGGSRAGVVGVYQRHSFEAEARWRWRLGRGTLRACFDRPTRVLHEQARPPIPVSSKLAVSVAHGAICHCRRETERRR